MEPPNLPVNIEMPVRQPRRVRSYDSEMTRIRSRITNHRKRVALILVMLINFVPLYWVLVANNKDVDGQQSELDNITSTVETRLDVNHYSTTDPEMMDGTYAITGKKPVLPPHMKSIYITYLLPHLAEDPNSLRPAFYIENGRGKVETVIGIPHVQRVSEIFLFNTIQALIEALKDEPESSVVIIVLIAEIDPAYVLFVSLNLEKEFSVHIASGLLEILAPAAEYYSNLGTMNATLASSRKHFQSRTKRNLDSLYLMVFAQPKGSYYLMLEEDVIVKPDFYSDLKTYANFTHKQNVGWTFIELKRIGGFGKLFNNASIKPLAAFIQIFYRDMSLNAMLDSYLSEKACPDNKFTKKCSMSKGRKGPKYDSSAVQNLDTYTSLEGKAQNIQCQEELTKIGKTVVTVDS